MTPLDRVDEVRRQFQFVTPDHIKEPIKRRVRRLVPRDAQSRREHFPLLGFKIEHLNQTGVVVSLCLFLQKEIVVGFGIASASDHSEIGRWVRRVLNNAHSVLAAMLAEGTFNLPEFGKLNIEHKALIEGLLKL